MLKKRKTLLLGIFFTLAGLCLLSSLTLFIINQSLPKSSNHPELLSENQMLLMQEANRLLEAMGNEVFPGWSDEPTAWVLYNETSAFAVGIETPLSEGWTMYPRTHQRGGAWQPVSASGQTIFRTMIEDPQQTPENFVVKVGDQIAASFQTQEYALIYFHDLMYAELPPLLREVFPYRPFFRDLILAPEAYISALAHEAFHVYQARQNPTLFEKAELIANWEKQYPFDNEILMKNWKDELEILQQAGEISTREEAVSVAEQFLKLREKRRQSAQLSNTLIDYERKREWLEGMAKYAELQIGKIAAQKNFSPLPNSIQKIGLKNYSSRAQFWKTQINTMSKTNMDGETLFYYSGFGQGVLLDHLMPDWKNRVLQGEYLEDLLAEAIQP
ncbi:MAG: hypothetical protein KatS3mg047_1366 [Bellilinea sp.]|nr:MAG: hypothetical protein KatS3mg047_1366 [Bellilinea sp.]